MAGAVPVAHDTVVDMMTMLSDDEVGIIAAAALRHGPVDEAMLTKIIDWAFAARVDVACLENILKGTMTVGWSLATNEPIFKLTEEGKQAVEAGFLPTTNEEGEA